MAILCDQANGLWRAWDKENPNIKAENIDRSEAIRIVQERINSAKQSSEIPTRESPFDGDKVIREFRLHCLRVWRKRRDDRGRRREKLRRVLATPRLIEVLEHFDSPEIAFQSMRAIFCTLCGYVDVLGYREQKEVKAYKEALDTVNELIVKLKGVGPLASTSSDPIRQLKVAAVTIAFELDYADDYMRRLPLHPEHIGTRGGASQNDGAKSGAVTRELDDLLPEIQERGAFIAKLMRAAEIDTYSAKVNATIKQHRIEKKTSPQ